MILMMGVTELGLRGAAADLSPKPPKFVLRLNLNEFSILNVSEMDGLLKYGGSGEFKLNMSREGTNEVVWTVTVENPRLMELLGIFVGERTVKLVQNLDPNSIDPNQRLALQAIKSLTVKLDMAQKSPVWDLVKVSGQVMREREKWRIVSKDGIARLTGSRLEDLTKLEGKPVVASGYVKVREEFELTTFVEQRRNTLELFVMSQCPFGQNAEMAVFNLLAQTNRLSKPVVEVRYLFYKEKKDGKDVWVSLHGEGEIVENLVQMVIRDRFSRSLVPYLRLRAASGQAPWRRIAEQAGLTAEEIPAIETALLKERESLIQREYDYATGRYNIRDGSPTFVWESERVTDLKEIDAFKGIESASHEACSQ